MILIFIGLLIRLFALLQNKVKPFWRIIPPPKLITTGIYRYVRHPMYLGGLISSIGVYSVLAGWKITICLTYISIQFILSRIDKEESFLLMHFGDKYMEYMKRTKMLIPFIF